MQIAVTTSWPTAEDREAAFESVRPHLVDVPSWYTLALDVVTRHYAVDEDATAAVDRLLETVPEARGRVYLRKVGSDVFVRMRSATGAA